MIFNFLYECVLNVCHEKKRQLVTLATQDDLHRRTVPPVVFLRHIPVLLLITSPKEVMFLSDFVCLSVCV